MKERIIPTKNYIIAAVISVLTLVIVLVLANYYQQQKAYQNEANTPMGFLSEIKSEELDNFLIENHDVMIYLANSDIDNSKLQNKVKKIITKSEYSNDIVYLNMKNLTEDFYTTFATKYFSDSLVNTNMTSDSLLIIKEGKVINIINITANNLSDLKNVIERDFYKEQ